MHRIEVSVSNKDVCNVEEIFYVQSNLKRMFTIREKVFVTQFKERYIHKWKLLNPKMGKTFFNHFSETKIYICQKLESQFIE